MDGQVQTQLLVLGLDPDPEQESTTLTMTTVADAANSDGRPDRDGLGDDLLGLPSRSPE